MLHYATGLLFDLLQALVRCRKQSAVVLQSTTKQGVDDCSREGLATVQR